MKSYDLFYSGPLNFLLPSIKEFSFSCPAKTWMWLTMAHHGCRCQIVIICWSPMYPSLLEKYLAVYLLQVNILVACIRNREEPQRLQAGELTGTISTSKPIVTHCFSYQPWSLKVCLSSESQFIPSLHLKLSRLLLGSILRSFWLRSCSVCNIHLAHQSDFKIKKISMEAEKPSVHPFRTEVVVWNLAEKVFDLASPGPSYSSELAGVSLHTAWVASCWYWAVCAVSCNPNPIWKLFFYSREKFLRNGISII